MSHLFDGARFHPFQGDPHAPAAIEESHRHLENRTKALDTEVSSRLRTHLSYLMQDPPTESSNNSSPAATNLDDLTPSATRHGNSAPALNADFLLNKAGAYPISMHIAPLPFEELSYACEAFEAELNEFTNTVSFITHARSDLLLRRVGNQPEGEKIKLHIASFSKDMNYRSSSLKDLINISIDTNKRREPHNLREIYIYIHDLSGEMGNDLEHLTSAFEQFRTHGVPSLQYEEKLQTDILISITTVGSLLSAVTVTALQISLGAAEPNNLISAVNSFWFASLVLSIGAALNSLLSVIWKRTPHGSRGRGLPIVVTLWINISAPLFLAISMGSFLIGLALYTYAASKPAHTKIITIVATVVTTCGVVFIIGWVAYELGFHGSPSADEIGEAGSRARITPRSWKNSNTVCGIVDFIVLDVYTASNHKASASTHKDPSQSDAEARRAGPPPRIGDVFKFVRNALRLRPGLRVVTPGITVPLSGLSPLLISPFEMVFPNRPSQSVPISDGTVQDIEYSPDGAFLATTSYNKTSGTSTTTIYGPGQCKLLKSLKRAATIHSAVWASSTGTDLLLVEDGSIVVLTIEDREIARHEFPNLMLRDVAVVPNTDLLLITGRVSHPSHEFMPIKSRGENSQIPFLDDIRHVRVSKSEMAAGSGFDILLSLKDQPSSMIWTLRFPGNLPKLEPYKVHPLDSSRDVPKLAGHAYFIGDRDQMIVCKGSDGTIYLWDRITGSSVPQRSPIKTSGLGLRSFAWRPSSTHYVTFASVHTTELKIWSAQQLPGTQTPSINVADPGGTLVPPASSVRVQRLPTGNVNITLGVHEVPSVQKSLSEFYALDV
ncbi:hypothetical protein DXG01_003199 [Tephrocybe rancida]|nr:hypothetical protein DXG01_003199 [Tephrocybe rancida]